MLEVQGPKGPSFYLLQRALRGPSGLVGDSWNSTENRLAHFFGLDNSSVVHCTMVCNKLLVTKVHYSTYIRHCLDEDQDQTEPDDKNDL